MINIKKDKILSSLITRFVSNDDAKAINSDHFVTIERLYDEIRENLEMLLNTKHLCLDWGAYKKQLTYSILNYGIKDFSHLPINNNTILEEFCLELKATIEHFEPRLKQVNVEVVDKETDNDAKLRLRISALIQVTNNNIPATFESYFNNNKYTFSFI